MNKLFKYPYWLPLERSHISFYFEKLEFFSKKFSTLPITHERYLLHLSNQRVSILEPFNFYTLPNLTRVGDRLAAEVAKIHKAFVKVPGKAETCDYRDFASEFYFDKNIYQEGKVFVGFQMEASNLLQQLASTARKQLQVLSIVGMAGLGKTTLATRLYNDPYVVSYFHIRAWVTCSQVYNKRNLLLAILSSVVEIPTEVCRMNDDLVAHELYRALKGRRYLIVIDDIWSSKAWDDFKISFPDDNNGKEESFSLFRVKAFITGTCYDYLSSIGKSIARKCRCLPLAIVVIAGLLKNNLKLDWWTQVEEGVSSYIVTDKSQYMDTLSLSYNHLPHHLRPCFLSFGAFPEDHDISVSKLIWLWIAEGYIHQDGIKKNLQVVAEDHLMELIGRSLVVVGRKGTNGAIKTCRIHTTP